MNLFLVYNSTTGIPKRWGYCSPNDVSIQAQSGEGVADITSLAGWDNNEQNWIWNGSAIVAATPDPVVQLAAAKSTQSQLMQTAYQNAISAPVTYTTAAGTTANFAQDITSKNNLSDAILGSQKTQVWDLNIWLDDTGATVTPFTYADLEGLSAAMEAYDTPKYTELLTLIAQINAATTVSAVQAISWT